MIIQYKLELEQKIAVNSVNCAGCGVDLKNQNFFWAHLGEIFTTTWKETWKDGYIEYNGDGLIICTQCYDDVNLYYSSR